MDDHVALTKRACRICDKTEDAEIILATRYRTDRQTGKAVPVNKVKKHHGQIVGFIEGGKCKECIEKYEGYAVLVEVDEAKTEDRDNPWRTGNVAQIKIGCGLYNHLNNQGLFKDDLAYAPIEVMEEINNIARGIG